jgi:membrane-bound serine protease (ClpP class)
VVKMLQNIFLDIFSNPFVVYILLIFGIYLLLFGLASPGMGMEIGGVICLALSILIGIDIASVVLFLAGIILFVIEAQTEGNLHGILALGGVACIIGGGVVFLQTLSVTMPPDQIVIMWATLLTFTIILSILFGGITIKVIESKKKKSTDSFVPKVGDTGIVKSEYLKPEGQVYVRGETWSAECIDGYWPIYKNEKIEVVKVEGVRLIVRPLNAENS